MEKTDRQILRLLAGDGRMSYTDLGKSTGLSTSAVHQRVKRLESRGVIKGYSAKIDYDEMLADMKDGTKEENAARKEAGYGAVDLVGWAVPPRYDGASKKLYWAQELAFEGNQDHTVNYDIRVLGRRGYLSLNAVAGMSELPVVQTGMQQLLTMTEFDAGARYADFDESTDKVAAAKDALARSAFVPNGTMRSFEPLPCTFTRRARSSRSSRSTPTSSEMRSPDAYSSSSHAASRRPSVTEVSGCSSSSATSSPAGTTPRSRHRST